ncbi:MAG: hypothetical protein EON93_10125 [Burkholderiales bacterium]|nr:MAG: hypothetical protein EON93_10125 [Burkholderiales bacterium]
MTRAFDTPLETIGQVLAGPWRKPINMLLEQSYDNHLSIHDDAMAEKLGFKAGPVEGPTHFSQFAPLGEAIWGERFLAEGCLSAHYRNMVVEGEEVRAFIEREPGADSARIWATKRDGTEVLKGTASVGEQSPPTALDIRLNELAPLDQPVILSDVKVGHRSGRIAIRMDADQHMGDLYPFSLASKLKKITEPSPWYNTASTPWGRAIVPVEMISVLLMYQARQDGLKIRGPAVGLFADQEIRLIKGPLFVGEDYEIEREIVALSGSRRTESYWTRTYVYKPGGSEVIATMLLNQATLKESYAPYAAEHAKLYPAAS